MILNCADVLSVLRQKGVSHLFHANSVLTACTFLETGHLLSRGAVQDRGLRQTSQSSDEIDRRYGIFHDLFVDGVDIHARARKRAPNDYGPVLFVLRMDSVFTDPSLQSALRITKTNPIYWTDHQTDGDRYYNSIEDFSREYRYGDFQKMLTFRVADGSLSLSRHLDYIVLDDPGPVGGGALFDSAQATLGAAARRGRLTPRIVRRACSTDCACEQRYAANWSRLSAMFRI